MRTWGRIANADGTKTWVKVETDANGFDDNCWLTTLAQALKLNLGESPFFANTGIPQMQTIVTQVLPDFYVNQIQQQFSPHFASLTIARVQGSFPPVYQVTAVCHNGAILTPYVDSSIVAPQLDNTFTLNSSTLA
ncbi:hypothetical protein BGLT_02267 [Caballeronia glathei]|uniref:hypothetical protein n=1 Tax=Caballeronia glathei TaxID=60547 RepID=UPI000507D8E3|nr:hypothetical protein [Caballeronia glathei]CDY79486.1 hypothetical protein BGLT_02267 [Caballeronia glathei]